MIYLSEINNRLYFYSPSIGGTFTLSFFDNTGNTTTLNSYSTNFTTISDLLRFFLFTTKQDATLRLVESMPKSLPFSLRYEKAMKVQELKAAMKNGVVEFSYSKKNGETRRATGTLITDYLPATKGTGRKTAKHLVKYFDLDKNAYRCFINANII